MNIDNSLKHLFGKHTSLLTYTCTFTYPIEENTILLVKIITCDCSFCKGDNFIYMQSGQGIKICICSTISRKRLSLIFLYAGHSSKNCQRGSVAL
jgi:hypothetical protein